MTRKTKILVIDDEETIGKVVKLNLERTGRYEVFAATTGQEGIRVAKEEKPDLVLLDIYMPGMSGPEVAENLADNPSTKEIPIVFLTGVVTSQDVEANRGMIGGRKFIAKPITTKDLVAGIQSVIGTPSP